MILYDNRVKLCGGNGVEKLHRDKSFKWPVIKAHAHTEQVLEGIKSVEPTPSLYFKARCNINVGEVSAGKGLAPQAPPRARELAFSPRQLALATPVLRKVRWADPWGSLAELASLGSERGEWRWSNQPTIDLWPLHHTCVWICTPVHPS